MPLVIFSICRAVCLANPKSITIDCKVHMTNWNVVPVVGFATVNMDWEQHIFGDGTEYMDCSKHDLAECGPHWQGTAILNNE